MLFFENLTFLPYQKGLLDLSLLSNEDLKYINKYHARCEHYLSPLLGDDERAQTYLKQACARIQRPEDTLDEQW